MNEPRFAASSHAHSPENARTWPTSPPKQPVNFSKPQNPNPTSSNFSTANPMQTFLLIAQNSDGYEPIGEVTAMEAIEFAHADMKHRSAENDDFCPEEYALWQRGPDGRYQVHSILTV